MPESTEVRARTNEQTNPCSQR